MLAILCLLHMLQAMTAVQGHVYDGLAAGTANNCLAATAQWQANSKDLDCLEEHLSWTYRRYY